MGLLFSLNGRIKLIYCLLFYLVIKMEVKSFCEKTLQTSQAAVKTFKKKKKIKMLHEGHTKKIKYYYIEY